MTVDAKLEVNGCYQIKGYACTGADKNTTVLSKNVTIRMGAATSITDIGDKNDIPTNYFEFGDYNNITRMSTTRDKVIGT